MVHSPPYLPPSQPSLSSADTLFLYFFPFIFHLSFLFSPPFFSFPFSFPFLFPSLPLLWVFDSFPLLGGEEFYTPLYICCNLKGRKFVLNCFELEIVGIKIGKFDTKNCSVFQYLFSSKIETQFILIQ